MGKEGASYRLWDAPGARAGGWEASYGVRSTQACHRLKAAFGGFWLSRRRASRSLASIAWRTSRTYAISVSKAATRSGSQARRAEPGAGCRSLVRASGSASSSGLRA